MPGPDNDNGTRDNVRIAAIQLSSGDDVDRNLACIDGLLTKAASRGVKLALLPENLAYMGVHDEDKLVHAEPEGSGPIQDFLADAAKRHDLWLVAGSIPLQSPQAGRCFGASLVIDPAGRTTACYRKIHLFDVDLPESNERYRESDTMSHGDTLVTAETPAGRLGLTICYDLRFPEMFRQLVDRNATIFSVPAAFTQATGQAHWMSLLRARAIENMSYVIAAGQYGRHPSGRQTFGHSTIVDPWGQVLATAPSGDAVVDASIDPALPLKLRARFPVLEHRRL